MSHKNNQNRLRCIIRHQVAHSNQNPEKENRFAWLKWNDDASEEEKMAAQRRALMESNAVPKKEEKSPIDKITNGVRVILKDTDILDKLGEALRKDQVSDFLHEYKWKLVSTYARGKKDIQSATRISNLIDDAIKGDTNAIKAVRSDMESTFQKKDVKPETDKQLAAIIKEENIKTPDKKSNWKQFLERIAQQIVELNNPLYTRLVSFLQKPVVQKLGVLNGQEAFMALKNPDGPGTTRIDLIENIANISVRNALGDTTSTNNIGERIEALEDLSAFLGHALYLFDGHELSQVIVRLSYVEGSLTELRDFAEHKKAEGQNNEESDDEFRAKRSGELKTFLVDENASKDKDLHSGLLPRLKKANIRSGGINPFGILEQAIEHGGWIANMPGTNDEKAVCVLIALNEVYRLYSVGTLSGSDDILTQISKLVRNAMIGKKKLPSALITDPTEAAATLDKKINADIKSTDTTAHSQVRSLDMLREWQRAEGIEPIPPDETMRIYEAAATATTEELEEEVQHRTDRLRSSIDISQEEANDLNALRAHIIDVEDEEYLYRDDIWNADSKISLYLRTSCTYTQLCTIAEENGHNSPMQWFNSEAFQELSYKQVVEKIEAIKPDIDELTAQRAYAANQAIKKEQWDKRESPIGHTNADRAYLEGLQIIRELTDIDEQARINLIGELNQEYERSNADRKSVHLVQLSEHKDLLFNAMQAQLRLGARRIKELYAANIDKSSDEILDIDERALLHTWKGNHITKLEHVSLRGAGDPMTVADATIYELEKLEEEVKDPLEEAREETERTVQYSQFLEKIENEEPTVLRGQAFINFINEYNADHPNEPDVPEYIWGAFVSEPEGEERIVLNGDVVDLYHGAKEMILTEERTHAINHAFMKYMNPNFLVDLYNYVEFTYGKDDLEKIGRMWMHMQPGEKITDNIRTSIADELIAKLEVYKTFRDELSNPDDIPKHIKLSKKEIVFLSKFTRDNKLTTRTRKAMGSVEFPVKVLGRTLLAAGGISDDEEEYDPTQTIDTGEGIEDQRPVPRNQAEQRPTEEPSVPNPDIENAYEEGSTTSNDMRAIEGSFVKIGAFFDTYPEQANAPAAEENKTNKQVLDEISKEFDEKRKAYQETNDPSKISILNNEIINIKNVLGDMVTQISKFDAKERDLSGEKRRSLGIRAIWWNVEWMSINDIVTIFKSIGEDIKRQHERRQQGRIGRVGVGITSWIGKIPILNELPYISTLSAEFQRRQKQAEVDEVENWKKALTDLDSYELQDMARHPANKDQLKAILNILAERGRIDWGDTKLWESLNKFSYYTMPIEKCERNESLREDWLRKIIGDIYDDKDHYRNWKTQNDGAIKSGKDKFTPEADRLSNLSGGLEGELEKQLRMFVQAKETNQPMPDDVHPHIYEEIIHYSIRNGKMSMEQKFFYLVQGLAYGLMSLDRLRTLAGEEGGVLGIFPFIDYFYKKNNSLPEVKALAHRLREDKNWQKDEYYAPGMKTTMWLELEVARQESVQQRLRKGIDKKSAEMDHDDMHFFIPRLDFETITAMALPSGGGKQKMSNDGFRNAYSGYNSFFKSLGILTKLEDDRAEDAKFTSEDAYQVIKAVAGYIRMDGILTKRSLFGDTRRPSISFSEMKNSYSVVSGGTHTVYSDRQKVDKFIKEIIREYGFTEDEIDELMFDTETNPNPTIEQQNRTKDASDRFQKILEDRVSSRGIGGIKNILKKHVELFNEHRDTGTYEDIKNLWQESMKAKNQFSTAS